MLLSYENEVWWLELSKHLDIFVENRYVVPPYDQWQAHRDLITVSI